MVGVEEETHYIVAADVLAFRHAGADFAGSHGAVENGVEILLVVADPR